VNHVVIQNVALQLVNGYGSTARQSTDLLRQELNLAGRVPIVYAGTLEIYQGIDCLLEAAPIVCQRRPDVVFLLVGGKAHQIQQWGEFVERHSLQDNVRFVGTVSIDQVTSYLDLADILVSPRVEGTSIPLKLYTYLHAGKAIVATKLPAHTLVLDHTTSVLVEPTSTEMAAGLLHLIQSPVLRERLGEAARAVAEREYSYRAYLDKLEAAYRWFEPAYASSKVAPLG
jgi:glycosyltransferase involved in cell wall biosynthesis